MNRTVMATLLILCSVLMNSNVHAKPQNEEIVVIMNAVTSSTPVALLHGQFGGKPMPFEASQQIGVAKIFTIIPSIDLMNLRTRAYYDESLGDEVYPIPSQRRNNKPLSQEEFIKYYFNKGVDSAFAGTILDESNVHHVYFSQNMSMTSTDQVVSFAPIDACRAKVTEQINITGGTVTLGGIRNRKKFFIKGTGTATGVVNYAGCLGVTNDFPAITIRMTFTRTLLK